MEGDDAFPDLPLWGTGPMKELLGVIRNELGEKYGVKWDTTRIFSMFNLLEDQINDLHKFFRTVGNF